MRQFSLAALALGLIVALYSSATFGQSAGASNTPNASALVHAGTDGSDWPLPGKNYANNRYTTLAQITSQNVHQLTKAWSTEVVDNGQQESALLEWHGTMYFATPHDNVMAVDAATGKVKWQFPYDPSYYLNFTVSRGIGLEDGKIFLATLDCRVLALDATTGKKLWNVNGCPNDKYASTANSLFSMAAYVYNHEIILGTAGGDLGNIGHVMAFSTTDGHRIWDWQTIPGPGQPGHDTWPGNSWEHGGGDAWGGVTLDPSTHTLFIPVGNPGPDLVDTHRKGKNLYTNAVVALDISTSKPRVRWYYQIMPDDTHDTDPAMPPVLFDAKIGNTMRPVLGEGDKAGNFVVLDRVTGKLIYRLAVDSQNGMFSSIPTKNGTSACPNHGGGIEWNGGSYDPQTNEFLVPSTQECATWKITSTNPQYIPGQPYTGGALPKRGDATGELTAINMATGTISWVHRMPYPAQGGVTITRTGLAFSSDDGGDFYAIDTKSGHVLWQTNTGASIVAPISVYSLNGTEYVAVLSGLAGAQQTNNTPKANHSVLTAYRLGPVERPIANTAAGQLTMTQISTQSGNAPLSVGEAPYTAAQVKSGAKLYAQNCEACHGAKLQGISAPGLTGSRFANAHLNLMELRTVVTTTMPLNAPGSLSPEQYADIMAYLLKYDCVKPTGASTASGGGTQPFPTTNQPAFAKVIVGGQSCP